MSSKSPNVSEELRAQLIEKAIEAKQHAYCPYSKFRVGAAVLTTDDHIITGCNVENASYGLGICAERTALCKGVSEGFRVFKEIAVSSDVETDYLPPCGACRQFIAEFGLDWNVILIKNKNDYKVYSVREVLPFAFDRDMLDMTSENKN